MAQRFASFATHIISSGAPKALRGATLALGATAAFVAGTTAAHAGYAVTTSANTGRGYDRGCAAQYNAGGTGASFILNDGGAANCIAGGGPGATTFNAQNVTVSGTTDKTGTLTAASDRSTVDAIDPNNYGYGKALATASADLATGQVHLLATASYAVGDTGAAAYAYAELSDTLHFTVAGANASTVTLVPVSFNFSGRFSAGKPGPAATLYYRFTFGNASATENGDYGAGYYNGTANYPTFAYPAASGNIAGWQSASFSSYDPQNTKFSGVYALTGASTDVPIDFFLEIIASNNVALDYTNAGGVSIGKVDGVSYTSDSGVFLTVPVTPVGGVPEPTNWALLISGFGVVGTAARRRRASVAA